MIFLVIFSRLGIFVELNLFHAMHIIWSTLAITAFIVCGLDFLVNWSWKRKTKAILIILGVIIGFTALSYALNYDEIIKRERLDDDVKALRDELNR